MEEVRYLENLDQFWYLLILPPSLQTSSHDVRPNGLRTGWPSANFEQVKSSGRPSPFRKFIASPEMLYCVHEVHTQFESVQMNIARTSLVWRGYKQNLNINVWPIDTILVTHAQAQCTACGFLLMNACLCRWLTKDIYNYVAVCPQCVVNRVS